MAKIRKPKYKFQVSLVQLSTLLMHLPQSRVYFSPFHAVKNSSENVAFKCYRDDDTIQYRALFSLFCS